jgi:hypothetical protein
VADDYFDEFTVRRQRLLWAIATRRQLERWEPYVAEGVRHGGTSAFDDRNIWLAETEYHFALIAARHLIQAIELAPRSSVSVDSTLRAELIEGRDLHEHWLENLPVFNVVRVERGKRLPGKPPPRRSGKDFAARNPRSTPYTWFRWGSKTGPMLLPNVSAAAVHELVDAVEAGVLAADPALGRFVPARAESPWLHEDGEWWPKPVESASDESTTA